MMTEKCKETKINWKFLLGDTSAESSIKHNIEQFPSDLIFSSLYSFDKSCLKRIPKDLEVVSSTFKQEQTIFMDDLHNVIASIQSGLLQMGNINNERLLISILGLIGWQQKL